MQSPKTESSSWRNIAAIERMEKEPTFKYADLLEDPR